MGGGGGGPTTVPFNMNQLAPFMPSVFRGPFNAQGAQQNAQSLQNKYPWIMPPAGQFAGAQPGQFAGAGTPGGAPPPSPPIPPTISPAAGSYNPQAGAINQVNSMQPSNLQQIIAALTGGA